jgi:hypothetical protein
MTGVPADAETGRKSARSTSVPPTTGMAKGPKVLDPGIPGMLSDSLMV